MNNNRSTIPATRTSSLPRPYRSTIPAAAAIPFALAGCYQSMPPPSVHPLQPPPTFSPPAPDLEAVHASEFCPTSGSVEALSPTAMNVNAGGMRGVVAGDASEAAEIAFQYRGPSATVAPLAGGEVRQQIGLKLHAQDTCNVIYVMWHIDPTPGVFVSVKNNPGQAMHADCGAGGYINVKPSFGAPAPAIREGETHTMRAEIDGSILRVYADGVVVWEGALPKEAFMFGGAAGTRTDNAEFDFELRVTRAPRQERSCVTTEVIVD